MPTTPYRSSRWHRTPPESPMPTVPTTPRFPRLACDLTTRDLATLLAWQARLIAEAIAANDHPARCDLPCLNVEAEVEALFPPEPAKHRWTFHDAPPEPGDFLRELRVMAKCGLCSHTIVAVDTPTLSGMCRTADAKGGCPGARA